MKRSLTPSSYTDRLTCISNTSSCWVWNRLLSVRSLQWEYRNSSYFLYSQLQSISYTTSAMKGFLLTVNTFLHWNWGHEILSKSINYDSLHTGTCNSVCNLMPHVTGSIGYIMCVWILFRCGALLRAVVREEWHFHTIGWDILLGHMYGVVHNVSKFPQNICRF